MTRLLWLTLLLAGCADLPWGAGGVEVSPVTRHALTRTLGEAELTLSGRRLANALTARFGHALPLRDLTLALSPNFEIAIGPVEASLGPVNVSLDDSSLVIRLELSIGAQPLTGLPEPCAAQIALAPGALVVPVDLTSDKLGRVIPVAHGARWDGQAPKLSVSDCALSELQVPDLAARLATAAWSGLQEPLMSALPAALGLDLALSTSRVTGLDALGTGIIRLSLRAAEEPLHRSTAGLAITFDLGLDADPHPCASAAPVPEVELVPPPDTAGTAIALAALERTVRVAWVAGAVCGASVWSVLPEDARELPLAELSADLPRWPGLSELLALEPGATVSATFWPGELPTVTADDTLEDALAITLSGLEADVQVVLDGARWRLFTLALDLVIRGQLAADSDGLLHFDVLDTTATPTGTTRGLGAAPPGEVAALLVEPIVRALLESRPLLRLPPSLTPSRTRVWRVESQHTILPLDVW